MSIEDDFDPQVAAQIQDELTRYAGKCHYDESRKKIVYHSATDALIAYLSIQKEEIELHKWIESEKCHRDLGREAMTDWVAKYSDKFARYWCRTHLYIPAKSSQLASAK